MFQAYIDNMFWFTTYAGIAIITWGSILSLIEFIKSIALQKKVYGWYYREARFILCEHLVYGLEFMVAGDIIRTIITPDYQTLILLAVMVMIRTVLNYFVDIELRQLKGQK